MNTVKELSRKWYKIIGFPEEFDEKFEKLLCEETDIAPMKFAEYDVAANSQNKGKNLIMFLYFCEELLSKYEEKGIPREIFDATVKDFILSVKRQYNLTGDIGIVRAYILERHLSMKLFKLGRLQFCMDGICMDVPEAGLKKGDNIIDIHIPPGEPLKMGECVKSFEAAEEFFGKFFPDFEYRYYSCHSWLLADNLKMFLKEDSNILRFQKLFRVVRTGENNGILNFMFKYGIEDREELRQIEAATAFAKKVKDHALSGGKFYASLGIRDRHNKEF